MELREKKTYVFVGNWHYIPGPRGYTVYVFDKDTGNMQLVEHICDHIASGQQMIDQERGIAYVVDEVGDKRGKCGGGGYVLAFRIDVETGHLSTLSERESLSPAPSYFTLDRTKRYAIVVHHTGYSYVTHVLKKADGAFAAETLFDDAAVDLFRINEDGSIGEICDIDVHHGEGNAGPHIMSHLHCAVPDPTGELFLVCDKGLDTIWSYGIDREHGKLKLLGKTEVETESRPRYGAFHPTLNTVYINCEKTSDIYAFHYDVISGKLVRFQTISMQKETSGQPTEASDIVIRPDGKFLYVTDRGSNTVAVFQVSGDGRLVLMHNVDCGGKNPRGICITPDSRFMLIANSDSASIAVFKIIENGMIEFYKNVADGYCPANICMATF